MPEPLRATVVGAGNITKAWFPALIAEGVRVVSVVDLDLSLAERAIDHYALAGAKAFDSQERALADIGSDFVVDLTVPGAHRDVTVSALRAGRHVIGEKPMSDRLDSAKEMVRVADETGLMLMVSQSRRWNAGVLDASEGVASGKIGTLSSLRCDFYLRGYFDGFRTTMPHVLLGDMAIHHFDLARKMSGADALTVYALDDNPRGSWAADGVAAHALFQMAGGVTFVYSGCWSARGRHTSWDGDWRLQGSEGSIEYAGDERAKGYRSDGDGFTPEPTAIDIRAAQPEVRGQQAALREMIRYIREAVVPQSVASDNIQSLAMVCAAIESCETGRPVDVQAMLD
ncbi:Gfo/Idh/MocA family protein [Mucisphaera sp.]|uniref:Gfo/Idh/MocA family protein n=1 Tax=Mucisphaera sp. TaxID=2913024 RepID=UPI003D110C22